MILALREGLGHAGRMAAAAVRECANILGLSHVELLVGDLDRSRAFYVDLLGFTEADRDAEHLYLRCVEDRQHHSLVLRRAPRAGLGHLAYKVADDGSLDLLARRFQGLGLPTRWLAPGEERALGRALRMQDPLGFPVEYHAAMDAAPWLLQAYHRHRGAAPVRVDHVNVLVPDARAGHAWYTQELGFRCSEYTESDPPESRIWASWLFRKPTVHDIAIMTGPGPAAHHVGVTVKDEMAVIRVCDMLASAGFRDALERGPARHGISNAFFEYVRDPDGNRVEFYTSDYLTADPGFEPIRWSLDDPRRQTLWGPPPPRRWFEEFMPVESIVDGRLQPTAAPAMRAIPTYVTD